jgi:hypothetical protein
MSRNQKWEIFGRGAWANFGFLRRGVPLPLRVRAARTAAAEGKLGGGDSVGVELLHLLLLAHPVRLADKARTPPAWGNLHHTFAAGSSSGRMCLWGSCVCAP